MNKNQTNKKCEYYNFGGDLQKGYTSYPTTYGARCEKYNKFFTMKDNELTPNCYGCLNRENKIEMKKVNEVSIYGVNVSIYKRNSKKCILLKELYDLINDRHGKSHRLVNKTSSENTVKATIYYKGQNRNMWFVNYLGLVDILSAVNRSNRFNSSIILNLLKEDKTPRELACENIIKDLKNLNKQMKEKINNFIDLLNS